MRPSVCNGGHCSALTLDLHCLGSRRATIVHRTIKGDSPAACTANHVAPSLNLACAAQLPVLGRRPPLATRTALWTPLELGHRPPGQSATGGPHSGVCYGTTTQHNQEFVQGQAILVLHLPQYLQQGVLHAPQGGHNPVHLALRPQPLLQGAPQKRKTRRPTNSQSPSRTASWEQKLFADLAIAALEGHCPRRPPSCRPRVANGDLASNTRR
mmetsp:Transcript_119010/g.237253  ORF Transcript_119010/g.237253 Transcript_119010/m.237253 type:complete len:212 (-) Transcript_119010:380-1015(-)